MDQMINSELCDRLSKMRTDGALDTELAVAWHQAAQALPDPSPQSDLAHYQINATAHHLGIGAETAQWWRHPTILGRFVATPGYPYPIGIPWAEEYYRGCAIVCRVESRGSGWWCRSYTVLPGFEEAHRQEAEGFATLADAYAAAMGSQILAINKLHPGGHSLRQIVL